MKNNLRSQWEYLGVSANLVRAFGLVLMFSFLVNLLVLTSPLFMMQVYDRVLSSGQVETLIFLSLIALAALIVFGALDAVRGFLLTRLGMYLDIALRDQVLVNAIARSRQHGTVAAKRLIDDLNNIRNYLGSQNILPFLDAPWVFFFIGVMSLLHPWFGVLGAGSALVLFCLAIANDQLTRRNYVAATLQQTVATDFAGAAIQNAELVHAMGMQDAISNRYRGLIETMSAANRRAGDVGTILSSMSKAVRVIVQSAALGLGAYLVIRAEMSPGGMISSSILLGRALAPIEQVIGSWRQFILARESYSRVRLFLKETPADTSGIALPGLGGRLSVETLFFQLPDTEKGTLRNISFVVEQGTAIALVGASASGKSTLCRLIVGALAPSAGRVRLDGADILSINPQDIRRSVGYMPQTVELFAGTVRENIARLGDVDDASVIEAAKAAGCHEMILRLARGYDTELGTRGQFLSGGQRQRIGLARALYGRPRLLVLDEPNAHLDQEGERALIEAIIRAKAAGTTVVVVNHRSTLLQPMDKLGVLRDGALERFGDRDTILREMQATQPSSPPASKPTLVPVVDIMANPGGKAS